MSAAAPKQGRGATAPLAPRSEVAVVVRSGLIKNFVGDEA